MNGWMGGWRVGLATFACFGDGVWGIIGHHGCKRGDSALFCTCLQEGWCAASLACGILHACEE